MINPVDNDPRVKAFKKQAKILLRQLKVHHSSLHSSQKPDITLRACHDLVVQQHGYKHWYEFHREIKNLYALKEQETKAYFFKVPPPGCINYGYSPERALHYCLSEAHTTEHTFITGEKRKNINNYLMCQAVKAKHHVVYMEGDGTDMDELVQCAKDAGRHNDLRILSFISPGNSPRYDTLPRNLSGSASALTEMMIALIDSQVHGNEGDMMWRGRAISFVSVLMMALVYMRDNQGLTLSFEAIRTHMNIDSVRALLDKDLPSHIHEPLKSYLFSIGYQDGKPSPHSLTQHSFLQMQFVRTLSVFIDTYGYLFSDKPSMQYTDLLGLDESLVVMVRFPCFEKCTDEMGVLAKFMAAMMKAQLQSGARPATKMTWFINNCPIAKGFSVLPAQARAFRISFVFSCRDGGLVNSQPDEAHTIRKTCNIHIEMKTQADYLLKHQGVEQVLSLQAPTMKMDTQDKNNRKL